MHPNHNKEAKTDSPVVFKHSEYALIAVIGLLYIALIGRYSIRDVDSRWFCAFSWAFWVEHIHTDTFMLQTFPDGMGGVIAFGKLAAAVQGALCSVIGWSLASVTLISIAFVLLSLMLLAGACRRLGYSPNFTFCFVALMGFTEPFLAVSQRARYEFLPVFLLSLALWLGARKRVVLSIFVAALATEVEPAAMVIGCAIATFLIVLNTRSKAFPPPQLIIRILLGGAAAAIVYLLLHPHILATFGSAHWAALDQGHFRIPGGFVAVYYALYKRHLPELAVVLAAIVVCIFGNKRHLLLDWPALCTAVILVLATLLRWPQVAYFAFIAPFLFFFVLQTFYADRYRNWIIAAILLFTLPQYIHRYQLWIPHSPGISQHDEDQVDAAIARAAATIGKPSDQLNILGDYALWFAHPHLFVNLSKKIVTQPVLDNTDLLICLDHPFDPTAASTQEVLCGDLNQTGYKLAETMTLNNHRIRLLIPIRQTQSAPKATSFWISVFLTPPPRFASR